MAEDEGPALPDNVRRLRRPAKADPLARRRWKINWLAQLWTPAGRQRCLVADISADGAKIAIPRPPERGASVSLIVPGFTGVAARVAWSRKGWVGLHFAESQPAVIDLVSEAVNTGAFDDGKGT